MRKMYCGKKKEQCALFLGIFFILFGLFLLLCWDNILRSIAASKFKLATDSETYEPWIKSRVPIYVEYYFFNWTNPGDLTDPNYVPELNEVGPYRFWEKIEKVNVTWNANGTVSYRRVTKWHFDPISSKGRLDDPITSINVILVMAANQGKKLSRLARIALNLMVASTQKIYITKKASEFLFEGFSDVLITAGRNFKTESSPKVPFDKFGWFYKRNGSHIFDGYYNVDTGLNGMHNFGAVARWNLKNETGFYKSECGKVAGSAGEFWPWDRNKDTNIYLFSPDLCRVIEYEYSKDIKLNDIDGLKYVSPPHLFDNGTIDPSKKCYCNGECLPSGVFNMSSCRYGAPVFTSFPHFYQADPVYLNAVRGLKPIAKRHENYIALEPMYGIPLELAARFQVNILVRPTPYLALLQDVKPLLFPVFWLDQKVCVPPEKLTKLKLLRFMPIANFMFATILILVGGTLLLGFAYCKVGNRQRALSIYKYRIQNAVKKSGFALESDETLVKGEKGGLYPAIKSLKSLETEL